MRFHALATDYDGTIAHGGHLNAATVGALERLRQSGRKLLLVTGRELPDLLRICSRIDLFHRVVAENGAVLYDPTTKQSRALVEPPPAAFAERLRREGVPLTVGAVIVATFVPHEKAVLAAIRDLGLELQVIFNKGAVMVLPSGVNKATGLIAALDELGLSPRNTVGAGDAENDHAFLRVCECAVAVANALPAVKETTDVVTRGERGAGVSELIDELIASDLAPLKALARHRIFVGTADDGTVEALDPAGPPVLVSGTSGSGKSTLTTALLERLADAGYQSVIVDPEGDYSTLAFATQVGSPAHAPQAEDLNDALKDPRRAVVVNLLGVPLADRPGFFAAHLLPCVVAERARTGRPHWLVIDEAHHMLPAGGARADVVAQLPARGLMFVTVHAGSTDADALAGVQTLLVIGGNPCETIGHFCEATGAPAPTCPEIEGDQLPTGEALVWRVGASAAVRVRTEPPRTERTRHLRKYAVGDVGPDRSFYFRGPKGKLNLKAQNLFVFVQVADGVDDETFEFHRTAGHFSAWVRTVIRDEELADEVVQIERAKRATDARAKLRAAIQARYTLPTGEASGKL